MSDKKLRPDQIIRLVAFALFVALGGTSLAASHSVITSTKQIKPSVLKSLTNEDAKLFKQFVANTTLPKADFANRSHPAFTAANAELATDATHAASATNATNATSATNAGNATTAGTANAANLLNGVQIVRAEAAANPKETKSNRGEAVCPAGLHAIDGGVKESAGEGVSVSAMSITSKSPGVDGAY